MPNYCLADCIFKIWTFLLKKSSIIVLVTSLLYEILENQLRRDEMTVMVKKTAEE